MTDQTHIAGATRPRPIQPGDRVTVGPNPTYANGDPCGVLKGGEVGYVARIYDNQNTALYSEPDADGTALGLCHVQHLTVTPEPTPEAAPVEPDTSRIELGYRHPDTGMVLLRWDRGAQFGDEKDETAANHERFSVSQNLPADSRSAHAALAVMRRAFDQAEKNGVDVDENGHASALADCSFPDHVGAWPIVRASRYLASEVQELVDAGKPLTGLPYEVRDHRAGKVDPAEEFLTRCAHCQVSQSDPVPHVECWRVEDGGVACCCSAPQATPTADTHDEPLMTAEQFNQQVCTPGCPTPCTGYPTHEREQETAPQATTTTGFANPAASARIALDQLVADVALYRHRWLTAREARETAERELAEAREELGAAHSGRHALQAEVERLQRDLRSLWESHDNAVADLERAEAVPEGSVVFPPGDPMRDVAANLKNLVLTIGPAYRVGDHVLWNQRVVYDDTPDKVLWEDISCWLSALALRAHERAAEVGRAAAPTEDDTEEIDGLQDVFEAENLIWTDDAVRDFVGRIDAARADNASPKED